MSDEPNIDERGVTARQLAQATKRVLPVGEGLDSEAASLREGFLQFGRAVEAASADFDEAASLARLTQKCLAEDLRPVRSPARNTDRWAVVIAVVLAASALLAIVRTVAVWPAGTVAVTARQPAPPAPAPSRSPANDSAALGNGPGELAVWAAWSDPLDEEIASAQAAVDQLSGRATGLDGSLEKFGSRLEALSAELESGSL